MTSAEKIINGIIDEARLEAEKITERANIQAAGITDAAAKTAGEEVEKILADAKARAEVLNSTGKSGAALIVRDAALAAKREQIEDVLSLTAKRINDMSDKDYFGFLAAVLKKSGASGEMCLSKKDSGRDISVLRELLSGSDVTLSDTFADINGGFILKCGDIEINAEPAALINERREELIDSVNKILFKEV